MPRRCESSVSMAFCCVLRTTFATTFLANVAPPGVKKRKKVVGGGYFGSAVFSLSSAFSFFSCWFSSMMALRVVLSWVIMSFMRRFSMPICCCMGGVSSVCFWVS